MHSLLSLPLLCLTLVFMATPLTAAPAPAIAIDTTSFSTYFRYAAIAYSSDIKAFGAWTCPLCLDASIRDTKNVTFTPSPDDGQEQGYVAVSPSLKTIIFAVRGSRTVEEWLNNLQIWKRALPVTNRPTGVEVHSGFWDVWTQLRPIMEPTLVRYIKANPGYTVTFVGHSLGGAVTQLAAVDFAARGIVSAQNTQLISFGQPRVGSIEFSQYFSKLGFKQVVRVINKSDIVPHLPPAFLDYRHQYHEYWINKSGVLVTSCNDDTNGKEATNCANTQITKLSVPDHLNYFGITLPK
ncbi:Alpha/Beta hydrolase protein [Chytriomyces cf. hyalinus JEL632]|nr:Alpha/Beta hydrolase protein [Chytriomyces cf. hyalinus JEL632]